MNTFFFVSLGGYIYIPGIRFSSIDVYSVLNLLSNFLDLCYLLLFLATVNEQILLFISHDDTDMFTCLDSRCLGDDGLIQRLYHSIEPVLYPILFCSKLMVNFLDLLICPAVQILALQQTFGILIMVLSSSLNLIQAYMYV